MITRSDLEKVNALIEEHDQLLALAREPLGHGYPDSVRSMVERDIKSILDVRRMQIVDELKSLYSIKLEV